MNGNIGLVGDGDTSLDWLSGTLTRGGTIEIGLDGLSLIILLRGVIFTIWRGGVLV